MREQVFASVDEYIASFPEATRAKLEALRRTIVEAAPGVEEKIRYDMPGYALAGNLVYFAGYKKHIGLYGAGGAVEALKSEMAPYVTGKGTLRFALKDPLPLDLISRVVQYRVEQNLAKAQDNPAKAQAGHSWPANRGQNAGLP